MQYPTEVGSVDRLHSSVRLDHHLEDEDSVAAMAEDVRIGLTREPKELPAKYLYDDLGSQLFEDITHQPEYYPTRTERAILERHADEMVRLTQPRELVELGAGSASKSRVLLNAMARANLLERYIPIDISAGMVKETANQLVRDYAGLNVHAVIADFERHLGRLPDGDDRLIAFLGGTIGNLPDDQRPLLLRELGQLLGNNGHLLVGTDLVKETGVLEAAYNDTAGVTEAFNKNMLTYINRMLDGDFDIGRFDHVAVFDGEKARIEMRLRATKAHTVRLGSIGLDVFFSAGEEMRTEISCKFTKERLDDEYERAGLALCGWFTDEGNNFALSVARPN